MSNGRNWCEIYVGGKVSARKLAELVLSCIGGAVTFTDKRSSWDIKTSWGSLSVGENDDYNTPRRKRTSKHEFLYYPYLIDAAPDSRDLDEPYEAAIKALVGRLRESELEAVIVSDSME